MHRALTAEELGAHLASVVPPDFAVLLADLDRAIAQGAEDRTTDTVEHVTGRPPHGFREVMEREWAGR